MEPRGLHFKGRTERNRVSISLFLMKDGVLYYLYVKSMRKFSLRDAGSRVRERMV